MHRNTFLFITGLSVFTALILGINLGKHTTTESVLPHTPTPTVNITPTIEPPITASPSGIIKLNESTISAMTKPPTQKPATVSASKVSTIPSCGITFTTPNAYTMSLNGQDAIFLNPTMANDMIAVSCEKETLTKPTTAPENKETKTLKNGVTANLYRNQSSVDGTVVDVLIFHHTTINKDVLIASTGNSMSAIITSLSFLP